jgi:hypothetical protein
MNSSPGFGVFSARAQPDASLAVRLRIPVACYLFQIAKDQ